MYSADNFSPAILSRGFLRERRFRKPAVRVYSMSRVPLDQRRLSLMASAVTIITGASGGIGEALASAAAKAGRKVVLVARSSEGLQRVADSIASRRQARPEIITLDLSQVDAADHLANELQKRNLSVVELINNAGYGLVGATAELDRAQQVGIVDLNIRALTDLTLRFLPEIIAERGGILNVASTAAFQP